MNDIEENSIEAVIGVLLAIAYADGKVLEEEILELIAQIPNLSVFIDSHLEKELEARRKVVSSLHDRFSPMLNSDDLESFAESCLNKITDPFLRPMVFAAMYEVSHSDQEYHKSERRVLEVAKRVWD